PREGERLVASAREISALGGGPLRMHGGLSSYYDPSADWGADYFADPSAIRALFPFLTARAAFMLHVRRAGFMNARKLGAWLLDRAMMGGLELVRDRVEAIDVEGGVFRAARLASGERIDARAFVLAAGPRLPDWRERLALDVPIVDERHGKVAFEDE